MPQSLAQILIHIVFCTKDRHPFLRDRGTREEMHRCHVHLLCALSRTRTVADIIKEVKRGSSVWIKSRAGYEDFAWQNGYGIFSIGYSQIEEVRRYIAEQEKHHAKMTFQDEFRKLLERYHVAFGERYLWD